MLAFDERDAYFWKNKIKNESGLHLGGAQRLMIRPDNSRSSKALTQKRF